MHDSIATNLGLGRGTPSVASIIKKPLNFLSPHVRDNLNTILLGTAFEYTRKAFNAFWAWLSRTFVATATFESGNEAYDWISGWIDRQPSYSSSRKFDVIARPRGRTLSNVKTTAQPKKSALPRSSAPPKDGSLVQYLPSQDTRDWIRYKSGVLRVRRVRTTVDNGSGPTYDIDRITITLFSFSQTALQELIEEAAQEHRALDRAKTQIYVGDQHGDWKRLGSKQHRTFGSVVLEPEVKRRLLEDATEFLKNESWYAERGIPYRRGYLLYGIPGSGKSSSIHALASELRLDIYVVPLSLKGIDDTALADLITNTPARCILLYEDIDVAFIDRSAISPLEQGTQFRGEPTSISGVTLSGLLNTIDGVQAQEGRLLFATTNHPERLDPALSRPGRMDVKIEYTHATRWQAEQLFRLFYSAKPEAEKELLDSHAEEFASAIPPREFSIAQLQGYLMEYKGQPQRAATEIKKWVEEESVSEKQTES
ncbi:hypothetical protein FRC11_004979 [Ceratobasidium sp. 423]|nr:hypothetical protein FRC11_004979 [Ceratobasidium sp. 423]